MGQLWFTESSRGVIGRIATTSGNFKEFATGDSASHTSAIALTQQHLVN